MELFTCKGIAPATGCAIIRIEMIGHPTGIDSVGAKTIGSTNLGDIDAVAGAADTTPGALGL